MSPGDTALQRNIARIRTVLDGSPSLLFITGAGLSADSGLPTYRGIGGFYEDAVTDEGLPIETVLAGDMIAKRPAVTWKYIKRMEEKCRDASYNRGHAIIAEMERHFERVWVLTQNVDGFHRAAGSRNVIDIHGDMHDLLCPACGWRKTVRDYSTLETCPPRCPECASIVRPDVVFFGEMLPLEKIQLLFRELARGFDVYFTIGTTSVFPYIREPIRLARTEGKLTVEINPGKTEVSSLVDIKLPLRAVEALELLWKQHGA